MKTATVTGVEGVRVRVRFPEDEAASKRLYSTLRHYTPQTGDTVLMHQTATGYICIGAVAKEGG